MHWAYFFVYFFPFPHNRKSTEVLREKKKVKNGYVIEVYHCDHRIFVTSMQENLFSV